MSFCDDSVCSGVVIHNVGHTPCYALPHPSPASLVVQILFAPRQEDEKHPEQDYDHVR